MGALTFLNLGKQGVLPLYGRETHFFHSWNFVQVSLYPVWFQFVLWKRSDLIHLERFLLIDIPLEKDNPQVLVHKAGRQRTVDTEGLGRFGRGQEHVLLRGRHVDVVMIFFECWRNDQILGTGRKTVTWKETGKKNQLSKGEKTERKKRNKWMFTLN